MSETTQPTHVLPADLPSDTWIPFEAFGFLLPGMNRRTWERGSKNGIFPAGRRMTTKSALVHRAGDIAKFFADCAAEVAQ